MRFHLLLACVYSLGLALAVAAQEHVPPAGNSKGASAKAYVPAGDVVGIVQRVNAADRLVRLRVQLPVLRGRKWETRDEEWEFEAADDVKVRLAQPPQKYDEKGNPLRYTASELRRMRDPLGYFADFDAVKSGQTVRLGLVKPKPATKAKDAPEPKPLIGTILIVAEVVR